MLLLKYYLQTNNKFLKMKTKHIENKIFFKEIEITK